MNLYAIPLGVGVGLIHGLLGGGGSIITVPILLYLMHFPPKQAIAMSLAIVGVTSLFAAYQHLKLGNLRWKWVLTFGVFASLGGYTGARLSIYMSGAAQIILLSALMTLSSFFMLSGVRAQEGGRVCSPWVFGVSTFSVGCVTGLAGIGGGFMIVPMLILLTGVPMATAVGCSLPIIGVKSLASFAGYVSTVTIPWDFVLPFTIVTSSSTIVGAMLTRKIHGKKLRRAFGYLLLLLAGYQLYRNLPLLTSH